MELSYEKVMPVSELKTALAQKGKREFIFAYGEILLRTLKHYEETKSTVSPKVAFHLMVNMADFETDDELYDEAMQEMEERPWLERKIIQFLQKRGKYTPMQLDLNELIAIGSTHYARQKWGNPVEFKKAMLWFANDLA